MYGFFLSFQDIFYPPLEICKIFSFLSFILRCLFLSSFSFESDPFSICVFLWFFSYPSLQVKKKHLFQKQLKFLALVSLSFTGMQTLQTLFRHKMSTTVAKLGQSSYLFSIQGGEKEVHIV